VYDGNFSAEQLKMKHPDDDVDISNGHSFMVTHGPYKGHLSVAKELKEVCLIVPYMKMIVNKAIRKGPVMTMKPSIKQTSIGSISFILALVLGHVQGTDAMSLIV
jgi:hypothetical protein